MRRRVACFSLSFAEHFNGMLVVIEELARAGAQVRVWTDKQFRPAIEAAGAEFVDLFSPVALNDVDDRSIPSPARGVTFAAARGGALIEQVRAYGAALVVHDSFAFVGRVVAEGLGIPRVTVLAGHAVDAAAFRAALLRDPRVSIDPRCHAAVRQLRDQFGIEDASPFSYVADPSPWLNVSKQPSQWLTGAEEARLGPLVHFGSLRRGALAGSPFSRSRSSGLRVYAAFGTVIWHYWPKIAVAALRVVAKSVGKIDGARLDIGLGGAEIDPDLQSDLPASSGSIQVYADQWQALGRSDLFVTHHGLSSTHEAIAQGVPMLSYPFFWDQPQLAQRSIEYGLAMPLGGSALAPRGALDLEAVETSIAAALAQRAAMLERVARAREWEREVIRNRPQAAQKILSIA